VLKLQQSHLTFFNNKELENSIFYFSYLPASQVSGDFPRFLMNTRLLYISVANQIELFYFADKEFFPGFFAVKLGHFIIFKFCLYVTNTQALQQKLENKEKKLYRITH